MGKGKGWVGKNYPSFLVRNLVLTCMYQPR